MEEKTFTWQEIQKEQKLIDKKKESIEEKIAFLEKEMKKMEKEEKHLITSTYKNGLIQISVKDFEKALDELEPEKEHKISIEYHEVDSMGPIRFDTPEWLKRAKNYVGNFDYQRGELELYVNKWPKWQLKKFYLPEDFEGEPKMQDMILCFTPDTFYGNTELIGIFAQAEKDRSQATNPNLSAGGKQ